MKINWPVSKVLFLLLFLVLGTTTRAATILQTAGSPHVVFEAEQNVTLSGALPTIWVSTNDAGASGGSALYAEGTTQTGVQPTGFARYQIIFNSAGTYHMYFRWRADSGRTGSDVNTANSFFYPLTFGSLSAVAEFTRSRANDVGAPQSNAYQWAKESLPLAEGGFSGTQIVVEESQVGVPVTFTLGTREAGFILDRVVLSQTADLVDVGLDALQNSLTDVIEQVGTDDYIAFEAESRVTLSGALPTIWVITNDAAASKTSALYAEGTTQTGVQPTGFARYQLKFNKAGTYHFYFRWRADSGRTGSDVNTANSFFYPLTLGSLTAVAEFTRSRANDVGAPQSNAFQWAEESQALPEGGFNGTQLEISEAEVGTTVILTLGTREAGFILDRVILHLSPTLVDANLDAIPNSGELVPVPAIRTVVGSDSLNKISIAFTRPLNEATVAIEDFQITPSLAVTGVSVDSADPRNVTLTTAAQTQGTEYTVAVTGVSDTSGTAIAANASATFTAWQLSTGWVKREIFYSIPGTTIAELTADAKFIANTPDLVQFIRSFSTQGDPFTANYGARLTTFFIPPANGAYEFFVRNDDEAQLFLSGREGTPEFNTDVALSEPMTLNATFAEGVNMVTTPELTAGARYRLTGLVKQGGGDVYLSVVARPVGSTDDPATLVPLSGNQITTFVNPDLGEVNFLSHPANIAGTAGARARFSVNIEADGAPVYYQWRLNGNAIPGAIRSAYTTPVLTTTDSGKKYSVAVSVAGRTTVSNEGTLTVNPGQPSPLQPYIGINFASGGDNVLTSPLLPTDVTGVVPQENFNNVIALTAEALPLVDAAGQPTDVTLSYSVTGGQNGGWYSGAGSSRMDADSILLQGYLRNDNQPIDLTLAGVPADTYNVYVYSAGFPFQATYEQAATVTGETTSETIHHRAQTGLDYNATAGGFVQTSSSTQIGNYVVFSNVRPSAEGTIVINVTPETENPGNNHVPSIAAVQLVKVSATTSSPSLAVARGATTVTISWDAAAAGGTLQSRNSLSSGSWGAAPEAANPLTGAGSITVTPTGERYFRIMK
ncbi:MAG: hypothetical protein SFY81_12090 [Verrucomicrobiota bacterium]|nr:hypothetical protein [Verrucomicrobiota bacterium]